MRVLVRDLSPGQAYVLQFRANTGTQVSEWSPKLELTTSTDVLAPAAVPNLVAQSIGTAFKVTWGEVNTNVDGSSLVDFKDYEVLVTAGPKTETYFVTERHFDFTLEANENAFDDPQPNITFTVRARDTNYNAVSMADASSAPAVNALPPAPQNFKAQAGVNSVNFTWDKVVALDLKVYRLYKGDTAGTITTLLYEGLSTNFTYSTTDFAIGSFYRVTVVDVFGQETLSTDTVSSSPLSFDSSDLTPPANPTWPTSWFVAQSDRSNPNAERIDVELIWNANAEDDLAEYVLRYKAGTSNWTYLTVEGSPTIPPENYVSIFGLSPNVSYTFQLSAKDKSGNQSAWVSAPSGQTTVRDNTAPPVTSTPGVDNYLGQLVVLYDGKDNLGAVMPLDVSHVRAHVDLTAAFVPTDVNFKRQMPGREKGQVLISGLNYDTTYYVRLVAVDFAGNESSASVAGSGSISRVSGLDVDQLAIDTQHIAQFAIEGPQIAPFVVDTEHIAEFAIEAPKIAPFAVDTEKIAAFAIGSDKIADFAVLSAKIADLAVNNAKIADLAVNDAKIATAAITNAKIQDLAVSSAKIAELAVTSAKIADLAVTNGKIQNLAVSEAKIANLAVTNAKIAELAVIEGKIQNLAVSTAKIAELAVTNAKIAELAVTSAKIQDLAVSTAKIANLAVNSAKIADLAVINAKIANLAVDDAKIANLNVGKLTTGELVAGVLVGDRITTAWAGRRFELNTSGLFGYDSDNEEETKLSSTGANFLTLGGGAASVSAEGVGSFSGMTTADDPVFAGLPLLGDFQNYEHPNAINAESWIDRLPRGIVAFGGITGTVTTSTKLGLFDVSFEAVPGRSYRVYTNGILLYKGGTGSGDGALFVHNSDIGTPDVNSLIVNQWLEEWSKPGYKTARIDEIQRCNIDGTKVVGGELNAGTNRLLLSIGSSGDSTRTHDFRRMTLTIEDVGIDTPMTSTPNTGGGSTAPTVKTYQSVWLANFSGSYTGNNSFESARGNEMHQGYYSSFSGNRRSLCGFTANAIRGETGKTIQGALAGATVKKVEVYLYFEHWYSSSGGVAVIGYHGNASRPSTFSGSTDRLRIGSWPKPGGKWVNLSSTVVPFSYWQNGTADGITLGPGPSTSLVYYGRARGAGMTRAPQLKITYVR